MRRGSTGLAVTGFILLALPAAAGAQDKRGGERQNQAPAADAGSHFRNSLRMRDIGPAPVDNTHMIESVELAGTAEIGLGLFSVIGTSEREQIRRRTAPATEVRDRDRRLPGVGMSIRF